MTRKSRNIKLEGNEKMSRNIFETPDGYFEKMAEQLNHKIEASASGIDVLPTAKELPFQTPDGYFTQLEQSIIDKTIAEETPVIPLYHHRWFQVTAVAASILFILGFYFINPINSNQQSEELAEISDDAIIEYLHADQTAEEVLYEDLESLDLILDDIIAEELTAYSDALTANAELNYHFEYFER